MAVLTNAARIAVSQQFMQEQSAIRESFGNITKADLKAAVDAADDYMNTNASAFNLAIPQPARGALSAAQKAKLLVFVVERRFKDAV